MRPLDLRSWPISMNIFSVLAFLTGVLYAIPNPPLDLYDQTWVRKWASIGDSYASGLGSGARIDYGCSRYSSGYAMLLMNDPRIGAKANVTAFQNLACSGTKTSDILSKQVPKLQDGLDVVTLSAGGNDVGLGDVLDACIFQWRHGGSKQCVAALATSQQLIDTVLEDNVELLLEAVLKKLGHRGRLYYPGYATFFGLSPDCNNVSWSVWPRMPVSEKQNLTVERQGLMNSMVLQVNEKLKSAIAKAGEQVIFIDWDWTLTQAKGRFCENRVIEPAPDRAELLFYEWNTLEDGEDKRLIINPGDPVPKDTFEGAIGKWIIETMMEHPDWEFGPPGSDPVQLPLQRTSDFQARLGFDDFVFWFLPDSWKRVFHPRTMGHHIIANMVLHEMAVRKAQDLGLAVPHRPLWLESIGKQTSKLEL